MIGVVSFVLIKNVVLGQKSVVVRSKSSEVGDKRVGDGGGTGWRGEMMVVAMMKDRFG